MTQLSKKQKIEYGDWQTPRELAQQICQKLAQLGVQPDVIIEPTCGIGNFIWASQQTFTDVSQIFAFEYNSDYIHNLKSQTHIKRPNIIINQADFFTYDWDNLLNTLRGELLVIGNFPWVTNSQQGMIDGKNLPPKKNITGESGLSALTGKSNFDISEWMLQKTANWFDERCGTLAMICKTSVARKFLAYLRDKTYPLKQAFIFKIDALQYFEASVEACLLYCEFDKQSHNYDFIMYPNLHDSNGKVVGYRDGMWVNDILSFDKYRHLLGKSPLIWRSGIKHDCSPIMELSKISDDYINGLGEIVSVEEEWIYPLLKGSDIANGKTQNPKRFVIIPQNHHQQSTTHLQISAPKLWDYLNYHANYFSKRKSRIYHDKDKFAIFGIGGYSFKPYKIAIASLYKFIHFELIETFNNKPIMLDDTTYFLGFDDQQEAQDMLQFLQSEPVYEFLNSIIFWDDKRPIKTGILNLLKIPVENLPMQLPLF